MNAILMVLALSLPYDAPAAVPSPRPHPRPHVQVVEPFDAVPPVDVPGEPQPDSQPPTIVYVPVPVPSPSPSPSPEPSAIELANAEPFRVKTQLGAMVVATSSETSLTPTISADADGPIAIGNGFSLGRIGVRIGLTSAPGSSTSSGFDLTNYRGVEIAPRLDRIIGVLGTVRTAVRAEYGFTTRIKGSDQVQPATGLSQAAGIGLSFDAPDSSAGLTALIAFDEATTVCTAAVVCTGIHSGLAVIMYGQVPILDGQVLFGGDVSIAVGSSTADVQRHSVLRVNASVDPVRLFKRGRN